MKYFYQIEALEKVINEFGFESGDPVEYAKRRTKKSAFSLGEKLLKRPDVYSVYINRYPEDPYSKYPYEKHDDASVVDEYEEQYCKYEGDKEWTNFYI